MQTKLLTLACFASLLISITSFCDTYVEGPVTGTWTVSGSPYIVQEDIYIPDGQTLVIEPGVEVRFQRESPSDPYELAVYGVLEAAGEPLNHITFIPSAPFPAADHWDGIKFLTIESSASEVSYCELRCAKYGIYINGASPTITYNEIYEGDSDGVLVMGVSEAVIGYNLIRDYTYRGFKFEDTSSPQVYNNTIVQNGSYGMYFTEYSAPEVYNNIIWGNSSNGIRVINSAVPELRYNDVFNNTGGNYSGISAGIGSISADPAFVSSVSNNFHLQEWSPCIDAGDPASPPDPDGTRVDMGAFYFSQTPSAPIITSIPDTTAITSFLYTYDVEATGVPDPTFSLSVYPTGMTINSTTGEITWLPEDSQAGDNNVTVVATNSQGQDNQQFTIHTELNLAPEITAYTPTQLDTTLDYGEQLEFTIVAEDPNGNDIASTWYYNGQQQGSGFTQIFEFGGTGEHTVKVVVTDGVLADSLTWNIFVPGTSLSGNLCGILLAVNNPHYMEDDVTILEDDTLTIEPGVLIKVRRPSPSNTLVFDVFGKLTAVGTEEDPIIFTPNAENPAQDHWLGVKFRDSADPNSQLQWCEIDHAYKGVEILGATIAVSYCKINSCLARGISTTNGGEPQIHHNSFWLNSGKAIYCYDSSPDIYNNTIVSTAGEGIYVSGTGSDAEVFNNISAYNTQYGIHISSTPTVSVRYNDAYGNSSGNYVGTSVGPGGLAVAPLMVNYTAGQFQLTEDSPCIDAGDPNSYLDPDGTFPEMGRYYFEQAPAPPVFSSQPDTMNIAGFPYYYAPQVSGVPWPTFTLVSGPPGMQMDPLFAIIEYEAAPGDTGTYTVDIQAQNSQATVHHLWTLHVNLNQPPIITDFWPLELDTVEYHQDLTFGVFAVDPDSHDIDYTWQLNGMPIGSNTNELEINSEQFGDNEVRVTVTDGVDQVQHVWNFFIRGTQINGAIFGHWNTYTSPYVAFSNVNIPVGDSLIIDAGVNVYFAGNYSFRNQGYLEVNGEYSNMVIFNSNYPTPLPDSWEGIIMEAIGDDNSRLTYCDVRHAHNGIKVDYASPQIDHCVLTYNGHYGVRLDHSSSEIFNITSTRNQTGGLLCDVSNVIINNSIIAYNQDFGINAQNANPVLSYNDVYNNTVNYSGCSMGWGSLNANPQFVGLDNFHLLPNSPCIDTGDPNRPNDPDGTRSDMGALYFDASYAEFPVCDIIPKIYDLRASYPNPFNAETTIEYWLPKASEVHLKVYSVLGREVAELAGGIVGAGVHSVHWNAGLLSSGIYFVRMNAYSMTDGEKFHSVSKVMLLK